MPKREWVHRDELQSNWLADSTKYSAKSLLWLAAKLSIKPAALEKLIRAIIEEKDGKRHSTPLYKIRAKKQKGRKKKRILHIPYALLKEVQTRINERVLKWVPTDSRACGYCGGSIAEAIQPHLGAETIWMADIKDAFPSIFRERIIGVLKSHFSTSVARLITLLCTIPSSGRLPQGAPTSPRLFDVCMAHIDKELHKIAEINNGTYSRYADNLFFSAKTEKITVIEKEVTAFLAMAELPVHKIKARDLDCPNAIRMLGLNVINRQIHNKRSFKEKIRPSIYRVEKMLKHGLKDTPDFQHTWARLQGQMQFARKDTLNPKLIAEYEALSKQVAEPLLL